MGKYDYYYFLYAGLIIRSVLLWILCYVANYTFTFMLNMLIGWVHAALYFNHHLLAYFVKKYYCYFVMSKCSFKSISGENVVV